MDQWWTQTFYSNSRTQKDWYIDRSSYKHLRTHFRRFNIWPSVSRQTDGSMDWGTNRQPDPQTDESKRVACRTAAPKGTMSCRTQGGISVHLSWALPEPGLSLPRLSLGFPGPGLSILGPDVGILGLDLSVPAPGLSISAPGQGQGFPGPDLSLPRPSLGLPGSNLGLLGPDLGLPGPGLGLPGPKLSHPGA